MSGALYATMAERYWTTYLPSEVAKMAPEDRAPFFASLGQDVADAIEQATAENLAHSTKPTDSPVMREKRRAAAAARAREEVLADLVYLPKEPGTADRTLPVTLPSAMLPNGE